MVKVVFGEKLNHKEKEGDMGVTPSTNSIIIEFGCQFRVEIRHGNVKVRIRDSVEIMRQKKTG